MLTDPSARRCQIHSRSIHLDDPNGNLREHDDNRARTDRGRLGDPAASMTRAFLSGTSPAKSQAGRAIQDGSGTHRNWYRRQVHASRRRNAVQNHIYLIGHQRPCSSYGSRALVGEGAGWRNTACASWHHSAWTSVRRRRQGLSLRGAGSSTSVTSRILRKSGISAIVPLSFRSLGPYGGPGSRAQDRHREFRGDSRRLPRAAQTKPQSSTLRI